MEESIEVALKRIIAQTAEMDTHEGILHTSQLVNDLGLDSLKMIDIVVDIDSQLGVAINEEDLSKIKTFQNLLEFVTQLSKNK